MTFAMGSSKPKVLFLTTWQPENIKAEWPLYQNYTLPQVLKDQGADVSIVSWLDESLTIEKIAVFDTVTFLWCNNYDAHPKAFESFLRNKLAPAQQISSSLKVINDTAVVLWNYDKIYLLEIQAAGFRTPKTDYIKDPTSFESVDALMFRIVELAKIVSPGSTCSVVIKPSVSASSKQTHLMLDPFSLTSKDVDYIENIHTGGVDGSLMIQAFEPAIAKVPSTGEFRCQPEFGGSTIEKSFESIPTNIQDTATDVVHYVEKHVGKLTYCRIDGVIRNSGEFVIMEVETIEPDLYLEASKDEEAKKSIYNVLMSY